jgi:hypothetical protein
VGRTLVISAVEASVRDGLGLVIAVGERFWCSSARFRSWIRRRSQIPWGGRFVMLRGMPWLKESWVLRPQI